MVSGGPDEERDRGLFDAMGIPESMRGRLQAATVVPVWPENWKTIQLFAAMGTQWRTGLAGATGLDYGALVTVAKNLRIKLTPRRFQAVQTMEMEALAVFAERAKHRGQ